MKHKYSSNKKELFQSGKNKNTKSPSKAKKNALGFFGKGKKRKGFLFENMGLWEK
jgi:hypothetical protein